MTHIMRPALPGRKFIAFLIMILSCTNPISAQQLLLQPAQLKEDFILFREALQKEHAGLYRYKSKAGLDKFFDSCLASLNQPMSQLEFAKSIMFLVSSIPDGHTGTNIPRLLMNYYSETEKMFPVYVFFIGTKAYALCSKYKQLPVGAEFYL